MSNKINIQSFGKTLKEEEFEKMNKDEFEDYLAENNIMIYCNPPNYIKYFFFKNSVCEEDFWKGFNKSHGYEKQVLVLNSNVVDEIFQIVESKINASKNFLINELKFDLNLLNDIASKYNLLKLKLNEYTEFIKNIPFGLENIQKASSLSQSKEHINNLLKLAISTNLTLCSEYLIKGNMMSFESDPNFNAAIEYFKTYNVLSFIQEQLSTQDNELSQPNKQDNSLKHSNNPYFKYEKLSEELFFYILKGMGAIDNNNHPQKFIKPVLSAIFEVEKNTIDKGYLLKGTITFKPKEYARWCTSLLDIQINNQYNLGLGFKYEEGVLKEYNTYLKSNNLPLINTK